MVKNMSSRMDKYYKEKQTPAESRTNRNKNIYDDVSDDNYEKLNLTSNVSIIKTDADLDLDSIKEIINEKYDKRKPKTPSIEDYDEEADEDIDEEETKEYDLKKVIETAHKNKTPNYDRERFEHLRETQYDILNSLSIAHESIRGDEELSEEEATLMNLIKTVNDNAEKAHKDDDSGDIMSELMGGDDTEVLKPVSFEDEEEPDKKPTILEELEKTKQLSRKEIDTELDKLNEPIKPTANDKPKDDENVEDKRELSKTEELSNSFYTGNYQIDEDDLDDFVDLEKEMKGGSVLVKILIVIIVLITIAVAIYLLNTFLNLGLF